MGLLGRVFGRSEEPEAAASRCNECGMTESRHTDWCPLVAEEEEERPRDGRTGRAAEGSAG